MRSIFLSQRATVTLRTWSLYTFCVRRSTALSTHITRPVAYKKYAERDQGTCNQFPSERQVVPDCHQWNVEGVNRSSILWLHEHEQTDSTEMHTILYTIPQTILCTRSVIINMACTIQNKMIRKVGTAIRFVTLSCLGRLVYWTTKLGGASQCGVH
jgi:hypothetical protein